MNSTCQFEDGVPMFVAVKSKSKHRIMSRDGNALYVRARPNNPYKRYVSRECSRDTHTNRQIKAQLKENIRNQHARFNTMEQHLATIDRDALAKLPLLLHALRGYAYNGNTITRVMDICEDINALHNQGKVNLSLWLSDTNHAWPKSGNSLISRTIKNWNVFDNTVKQSLIQKFIHVKLLIRTNPLTILLQPHVSACYNLKIGPRDDIYDVITQEDISTTDDLASVTDADGHTACIPLLSLYHSSLTTLHTNTPSLLSPFRKIGSSPVVANNTILPLHGGTDNDSIDFIIPTICLRRIEKLGGIMRLFEESTF